MIRLTAAVLGTPDPPGLARSYQRLLGWTLRDDEDDWAALRPAGGGTGLSFQLEPDHVPPVWPPEPGTQQMQTHLDLEVDDLDAACALAGGRRPAHRRLHRAPRGRAHLRRPGRSPLLPVRAAAERVAVPGAARLA